MNLPRVVVLTNTIQRTLKKTEKQTPTLEDFKRECKTLLTDIGGGWYLSIMCNSRPPTKKTRLSRETIRTRKNKRSVESSI